MIVRALAHPRGVLVVTGAFFVTISLAAVLLGILPVDDAARLTLLSLASPDVIAVMRIVNYMGQWQFLVPATALLFVVFHRARERWWLWVGLMTMAPVVEGILKYLIGRPRPEDVSFGFPSGHATAAAAYFGAVMYLAGALPERARRWVRIVAPLAIILVGVARVMLRAHWPSDVLGGITLGLALASATSLIAATAREVTTTS